MPSGLARNTNFCFTNRASGLRIIDLIQLVQFQESRALLNGTVVSWEVIQKFPPILSAVSVDHATRYVISYTYPKKNAVLSQNILGDFIWYTIDPLIQWTFRTPDWKYGLVLRSSTRTARIYFAEDVLGETAHAIRVLFRTGKVKTERKRFG